MTSTLSSILAQAGSDQPLVQGLVFDALGIDSPGVVARAIYSVALVALVFLPAVMLFAMFAIWWERKVAGHMQSRLGPNRVGPIGLLQSLADGIKLLTKEDLLPRDADGLLFRLAPYIAFVPPFAAFLALPFGPDMTFEPRLAVGLFWLLAILSVEVMGVILAGWASNNKWSIYGAMREACQMVSYEIPLGISIIVGVMAAGTLNLVELGYQQGGGIHTWLIFRNPFAFLAFVVYFIASLASNKRAPFDLPESESELVAGFHTEYSGLRFAMFFFAEYAAMFVVGGIQTALFLGGWNDPFGIIGWARAHYAQPENYSAAMLVLINLIGVGIFVTKALAIVFVQMWLRWTLPRPRIDQVLYACVKVLLPLSCLLLLGGAIWQLLVPDWSLSVPPGTKPEASNPWLYMNPFLLRAWQDAGATATFITQVLLMLIGLGLFIGLIGWVMYAAGFEPGRKLRQRLTDPAPLERAPENLAKA